MKNCLINIDTINIVILTKFDIFLLYNLRLVVTKT